MKRVLSHLLLLSLMYSGESKFSLRIPKRPKRLTVQSSTRVLNREAQKSELQAKVQKIQHQLLKNQMRKSVETRR